VKLMSNAVPRDQKKWEMNSVSAIGSDMAWDTMLGRRRVERRVVQVVET